MVNVRNYIKKEVIRRCPYCHHDVVIKKGLSSENIKRLFRKPTMEDFIILFIILLTIGSFLIYNYEIKAYKAYINDNCPLGLHNQQNVEIYLPGSFEGIGNLTVNNNSKVSLELNNAERDDEKG